MTAQHFSSSRTLLCSSFAAALFLAMTGCDGNKSKTVSTPPPAPVETHLHPAKGPHHGDLIELGNEEFHVEMVHDDAAGAVTIYILDSAAKVAVPIDATELVINLKHDGKPEQFKLMPSADIGDPAGKSSRFTLKDADLAAHIEDAAAAPKMSVNINGKPYSGEIKHQHDHE